MLFAEKRVRFLDVDCRSIVGLFVSEEIRCERRGLIYVRVVGRWGDWQRGKTVYV